MTFMKGIHFVFFYSFESLTSLVLPIFRSNFLGTKFLIYDTQPPYNGAVVPPVGRTSRRFNSTKVSPKLPSVSYNIAQVSYELNVLGTRGPRRMRCIMHSIPASSVEPGGIVPGQPEQIVPRALEDSFRSTASFSQSFRSTTSLSKSIMDSSMDFNSARFSDIAGSSARFSGIGSSARFTVLVVIQSAASNARDTSTAANARESSTAASNV